MAFQHIAVIPLRAGSKSIPKKNLKPLLGRPLFDWALQAARASGVFENVWIATDSEEVASLAGERGAAIYWRSPESATATAPTESVLLEFLDAHPTDVLTLIQATSPLTRPEHFREAAQLLQRGSLDSLVTVTRQHRFRWSAEGEALNYDPVHRPRRQDWPGELHENGAFYMTRSSILMSLKSRLGGRIGVYEMPPATAFEIDEPDDWIILEQLAGRYGYQP